MVTTDFQHCVWLLPASSHSWHTFIPGVPAHVSVQTHLTADDASAQRDVVQLQSHHPSGLCCLRISLQGKLEQTHTNDFYALEYRVALDRSFHAAVPDWWPPGAHISFAYRHGTPFSRAEMDNIEHRLRHQRKATLVHVLQAHCTGHYTTWDYVES